MISRTRILAALAALAALTLGASTLLMSPAHASNPDPNPPTVQIGTHPNLRTNASQLTFDFVGSSTENKTYTCTLSDQPTYHQACTSGVVYTSDRYPTDGPYTFTVEVTDEHARTGSASFDFVVDRTPPTLTVTSGPTENSVSMTRTPTYTWTNSGAGPTNDAITNSCAIDGTELVACSSPLKLGPLSVGPHFFVLRASDSAGNPAPHQTLDFTVAGSCNVSLQTRVAIRSPKATAQARLSPNCETYHRVKAAWSIKGPTGVPAASISFSSSAISTSWTLPDSARPGTYTATGASSTDVAGHPMVQNTSTTIVRLASRHSLAASRSGKNVKLTVGAASYSPAKNKFVAWAGRGAVIQYRTCPTCTWKKLRTVRTGPSGKVTYTFKQNAVRYYRVVSGNTATTWGATSATVHR